jgi:CspA family cold shock protein
VLSLCPGIGSFCFQVATKTFDFVAFLQRDI